MNKSAPKSGQKWTVVGDLNQFLAHSNGFSGEDYAHQPQQHTGSPSAQLNQLDSSHYREAGIIEKLLPSYGFIQCCERQARLFFHYSQFNGKIEHLHVGDAVEFEMTYDKRTGKPIASFVVKISSEAIGEESAVERVTGFITIELNADKEGRVAYENRGECFFLPFGRDDLDDPNTELRSKDRVTFLITKDKNGTPRARHVALETPSPQRFRGVVCTIKDSFGFIERADQVREIFFHSSECAQFKQLQENDSVEFSIQVRNNKEVATSVDLLERGTSQFEKFVEEGCIGQVLEPIDRSKLHPQLLNAYNSYSLLKSNGYEPFPGKILYRQNGEEIEIPLGYREVKYTLQIGDWVRFKIVLDTRDQQRYAADVTFLEETLKYSGEKRIQGQLMNLVGDKGFIQDANGTLYMFHHHEIINPKAPFEHRQMVEFTPAVDSTETSISNGNGGGGSAGMPPMAIRVIAGCQSNNDLVGAQSSSPSHHAMKGCVSELSDASRTGRIRLFEQVNGCPEQVTFSFSDVVSDSSLFINDRVDLKLEQVEPNTWKPSEIRIIKSQVSRLGTSDSASGIDLPAPHYMPHSGSIRALSRFKGILHSNLLANKDIFFNVINLPAGLFSIESVFDFHVDFDHEANVLRAYDIRISTDSPDTAFDPNLDTFKSPKSDWGAAERFGQKLSGKIEYLSRDGGILVRGHHRYQFQMSEFPLLMVDLNNEFEFVVSLQTGLQNLWQAVELNPIASSSDTNQSTALRRQKGFVVKLNKFGGLLQANRNRYPFSFQSFLDTPIGITYNDEIEFSLEQRNGRTTAIDLEPIASKAGAKDDAKANGKRSDLDYSFENAKGKTANRSVQRGFVAAIKESYGFIESEHYDQEVFFHFRYDSKLAKYYLHLMYSNHLKLITI